MELGRLIRESRLKKGMSLAQLAAAVGRSSSSVRRWERGEVPPAKAIMGDLASALDLDESQLDELRPSSSNHLPQSDGDASLGDGQVSSEGRAVRPDGRKHTTLEQPIVAPDAGALPPNGSPATTGPSPDSSRSSSGLVGDIVASYRAWTEDWSGWIRGGLTLALLIVMLVVLIWAIGELLDALGEIWDSFDAEPNR